MSEPFRLDQLPTLSRSTVDRQETLRHDPENLRLRWPQARVLLLSQEGRSPVRIEQLNQGQVAGASALSTRDATDYGAEPPAEAVFLGQWQETDYWAMSGEQSGVTRTLQLDGSWGDVEQAPASEDEVWVDLRSYGNMLDDTSAGLFTTAFSLRNWHRRGRFCARCGNPTTLVQFGWASRCEGPKQHEEYPRTDPAVICLVHDETGVNGEWAIVARQPIWPAGRYSVLAGFVEAGESLEGCVAREIREEVGAEVRDIRYLGSQPWPFPRSIMLGFTARADRATTLRPADGEIESAMWVSRDEVRQAMKNSWAHHQSEAAATPVGDGDRTLMLPGNSSIARVMLEAWANAEA